MIGGINLYLSVKDFASVMFARWEEKHVLLVLLHLITILQQ